MLTHMIDAKFRTVSACDRDGAACVPNTLLAEGNC